MKNSFVERNMRACTRSGLISQFWQLALVLVTCIFLFAHYADALAQADTDSSNGSDAGTSQDETEGGFWDWLKKNIEIENPDDPSNNEELCARRTCDDGGGDGDGGGGGGHG